MTLDEAKEIVFTGKDLFPVKVDRPNIVDSLYLHRKEVLEFVDKIYADFKIELEDAKAQGFREAIKEMDKVK